VNPKYLYQLFGREMGIGEIRGIRGISGAALFA
jgi:hypothetical protein